MALPSDIARCSHQNCKFDCARKEHSGVTERTPFHDFSYAIKDGKCGFQKVIRVSEIDLSHHRFYHERDFAPFIEKMGEAAFEAYRKKVFDYLRNMEHGYEFDIIKNVEVENYELFIKVVGQYRSTVDIHIYFSDDFTIVSKI